MAKVVSVFTFNIESSHSQNCYMTSFLMGCSWDFVVQWIDSQIKVKKKRKEAVIYIFYFNYKCFRVHSNIRLCFNKLQKQKQVGVCLFVTKMCLLELCFVVSL